MNKKKRNKEIGDLGESIACSYLQNQGFEVIARNYWKKYGEIDIVARRTGKIHFCEVKTVSHETIEQLSDAVLRGTWRPEEQVHQFKLGQIHKALQAWVAENQYEGDWQIDVLAVRVVPRETYATVKYISNVVR